MKDIKAAAPRKSGKILTVIIFALTLPLVLFEYFVAFWFAFGGEAFNAIATPLLSASIAVALVLLKKKLKLEGSKNKIAIYGIAVLTPIAAMGIASLLALMFGIDMNVM